MADDIKKSSIISLRIDHYVVEALREEAAVHRISLNVLANNVLQNYVEWDREAGEAGFLPITKDMLTSILNKISEEDIKEIVEQTKDVIKAQIVYMEELYDIQSFLRWLRNWCRASGFGEKEFYENGALVCIIQHDIWWKWSLYFQKLIKAVLEPLVHGGFDFDLSSSMLILRMSAEQQAKQSVVELV